MPFLIPILPAIIAAGASVTSGILGYKASQAGADAQANAQKSALEQQAKMAADQQAQTAQQNQRIAVSSARQEFPNLQSALGGAVSPEYYANAAAAFTGNGDQLNPIIQAALKQFGVSGTVPSQGLTPSDPFSQGQQFNGGISG